MRILITGGAGFIGSNLALKLLEKGHEVIVMDILSEQIHGPVPEINSPLYKSIKDVVEFYKGDVCLKEDWQRVLPGVEVIVHLAAETGTGQSMYEIDKYSRVNVGATSLMLDILANDSSHTVKKVVIASSRSIYGEGKYYSKEFGIVYPDHRDSDDMVKGDFEVKYKDSSPLIIKATDEESMIHPSSVYGITKQTQEQLVMCVCKSIGMDCIAFRFQNVYGPGQSLQNPYTGILSIFSTLIRNNKPINVFEDGKESRDFVYIDDVVNATILGIEKPEIGCEIFNVGSGVPISVMQVAETLIDKFGIEVNVNVTGNFRIGDIRHNFADLSKINQRLSFYPTIDFETGIGLFVEWVNSQEIAKSKFEQSFDEMRKKGLLK